MIRKSHSSPLGRTASVHSLAWGRRSVYGLASLPSDGPALGAGVALLYSHRGPVRDANVVFALPQPRPVSLPGANLPSPANPARSEARLHPGDSQRKGGGYRRVWTGWPLLGGADPRGRRPHQPQSLLGLGRRPVGKGSRGHVLPTMLTIHFEFFTREVLVLMAS